MDDLYLIAILPPSDLSNEIDEIRKACAIEHHVYSALKPPVHITLIAPFKLNAMNERKLIKSLKSACSFQPFVQKLKNFDGFPEHTVYINAIKNDGISAVHKKIKTALKPFSELTKGGSLTTPHITIAYRDAKEAYPRIIEQYQSRHFNAEFMVNHFTLLKHDGKRWNIHSEYFTNADEVQLEIFL